MCAHDVLYNELVMFFGMYLRPPTLLHGEIHKSTSLKGQYSYVYVGNDRDWQNSD